jgi:hypothetical protein
MTDYVRNVPTPEGRALGKEIARLTNSEAARLLIAGKEVPYRCKTCAFRGGTFPNGCPETIMDATKCAIEGVPFLCHETHRKGELCGGWSILRSANGCNAKAPWDFTPGAFEVSDA